MTLYRITLNGEKRDPIELVGTVTDISEGALLFNTSEGMNYYAAGKWTSCEAVEVTPEIAIARAHFFKGKAFKRGDNLIDTCVCGFEVATPSTGLNLLVRLEIRNKYMEKHRHSKLKGYAEAASNHQIRSGGSYRDNIFYCTCKKWVSVDVDHSAAVAEHKIHMAAVATSSEVNPNVDTHSAWDKDADES